MSMMRKPLTSRLSRRLTIRRQGDPVADDARGLVHDRRNAPNKAIVYVGNGATATIRDLTVDGNGQGNNNYRSGEDGKKGAAECPLPLTLPGEVGYANLPIARCRNSIRKEAHRAMRQLRTGRCESGSRCGIRH